jgi:hypothetical protein
MGLREPQLVRQSAQQRSRERPLQVTEDLGGTRRLFWGALVVLTVVGALVLVFVLG